MSSVRCRSLLEFKNREPRWSLHRILAQISSSLLICHSRIPIYFSQRFPKNLGTCSQCVGESIYGRNNVRHPITAPSLRYNGTVGHITLHCYSGFTLPYFAKFQAVQRYAIEDPWRLPLQLRMDASLIWNIGGSNNLPSGYPFRHTNQPLETHISSKSWSFSNITTIIISNKEIPNR